uniref:Uncharacterized protein n=1 Tax=Strongyloides papillosus TaxID=174720 RepID=A0A0N5BTZ5_STREA
MDDKCQKNLSKILKRLEEIDKIATKEINELEEKIKKITETIKEQYLILQQKNRTEKIIKNKINVLKERNVNLSTTIL